MRRGEVWTVSGGRDYAGKPRAVVILQDDAFDATDPTDAPLLRLPAGPNQRNGLRTQSRHMVDKITTLPKSRVGERIGRVDDEDPVRLNQAVMVFLGLAESPRTALKRQ
jgi:mRNA interferase MazF